MMELDILGSAESFAPTVSRLPGGKFSIRSGTSQIETVILAIGCSLVRFDPRLADLLPDPDRAPQPEVGAPETDDE
jgi:hypothetical protein